MGQQPSMVDANHPMTTTQNLFAPAPKGTQMQQQQIIINNGSQSTRHSRQVSHAAANNNHQELQQIYSARNNPTNSYMNNNPSGSQPATSRKELKFSQSKDNLDRSQHQQQH
jgi:hypothetical protein